jgi:hypothetical protein
MFERALQRLAAAGIDLLPIPELTAHYVFYRNGCAALVERTADGFGEVGSSGRLTEAGFSALVWREARPYFVAHARQEPATDEEVQSVRQFAADLESALRGG